MKNLPLLLLLAVGAVAAGPVAAAAARYSVLQRHSLGGSGGWDYLSIDAATHRLFIARNDRVMVVDTRSGKLFPACATRTAWRWCRRSTAAMSAMATATASA